MPARVERKRPRPLAAVLTDRLDKPVSKPKSSTAVQVHTVMLDTLANRTYSLDMEPLRKEAEAIRSERPKLYDRATFFTRYSFWLVFPLVERLISRFTGSVISCALVYSNPLVVSSIVKSWRNRSKKNKGGIMSRPNIASYIGTFAIATSISYPTFIFLVDKLSQRLSDGAVTPLAAAGSVALASMTTMALEQLAFYHIWKRWVLRKLPRGSFKDAAKGFISEFKPFQLFSRKKEPKPAETAGQYVGQLCGVVEKHFFWVRTMRVIFATALAAIFTIPAAAFASSFLTAMAAVGFGVFIAAITAKYYDNISNRIDENNKHLKL